MAMKASIPHNLEIIYSDRFCGESEDMPCPYGTQPHYCSAFRKLRGKVYREAGLPWFKRVSACLAATKDTDDPPTVEPKTIWEHLLRE